MPLIFDKIKYNQKIFLPKLYKKIDLNFILDQYKSGEINKLTPMNIVDLNINKINSSLLPNLE
jgi:hypothetical protein